jgi:hypothetical protein
VVKKQNLLSGMKGENEKARKTAEVKAFQAQGMVCAKGLLQEGPCHTPRTAERTVCWSIA